ncbi:hypothetical protein ACP70R_029712 [Stipagrostis hirtigluma subsp. patula]
MHRLSPSSRRLLYSMASASAPPRWWSAARARGDSPRLVPPDRPARRVFRFPRGSRNMASSSGVEGEELGKPDSHYVLPSADNAVYTTNGMMFPLGITQGVINEENKGTAEELIACYGHAHPATEEDVGGRATLQPTDVKQDAMRAVEDVIDFCGDSQLSDGEEDVGSETEVNDGEEYEDNSCYDDDYPPDGVVPSSILECSSHRDGSIYRGTRRWQTDYCIADRNETRLEAMRFSDTIDCVLYLGTCIRHPPGRLLQIFLVKLAKIPMDSGSVELYGYIAMRDCLDPLLNYVVKLSRDDPIVIEQGSLIELTGPK